tara:strand:- start:591 stop:1595 length:1005 start_codon:yes stop_codon:yes gene_type:complete
MRFSLIEDLKDEEYCIYFSKSYQELFSRIYNSNFKFIKFDYLDKTIYLPLIFRKLKDNNYEAFSSYGYGGLIGEDIKLRDIDIINLRSFLSSQNVHSLFIRHSPFLQNHNFWPEELLEANRISYESSLSSFLDFNSFKKKLGQKIRASINHAEKNNYLPNYVEKPLLKTLNDFYELYVSRMNELSASKFYYFDYKFFEDHFLNLAERCKLLTIQNSRSKIVAGAIFLCDPKSKMVHYHLSASSKEAFRHQCNELLISYAIFFFGKSGYKKLHLGGGIKYDESDGLSRFKKKFSDSKKVFYITKLICNSDLYNQTRNSFQIDKSELFLIGDALEK